MGLELCTHETITIIFYAITIHHLKKFPLTLFTSFMIRALNIIPALVEKVVRIQYTVVNCWHYVDQ